MTNEMLLNDFKEQLNQADTLFPGARLELIISKIAFRDWRSLRQSDWADDGWGGEDQDLTSIDRDDDVFLSALKKRLGRQRIVDVRVVAGGEYMEIAPVADTIDAV